MYGESSGTPAALKTMSAPCPPLAEKSRRSCPPRRKRIFRNRLSFATDDASSFALFLSVTSTFSPHCARNAASPTPRPRSPSPMRVIRLSFPPEADPPSGGGDPPSAEKKFCRPFFIVSIIKTQKLQKKKPRLLGA